MPPVLDVTLFELMRGSAQNVGAGDVGRCIDEGKTILKLIAESQCSAGLINRRTTPDAAAQRLIEQPAIQDKVCCGCRRLDLQRSEQPIPSFTNGLEFCFNGRYLLVTIDDLPGAIT